MNSIYGSPVKDMKDVPGYARDLLPCPFCGGNAAWFVTHAIWGGNVEAVGPGCLECRFHMPKRDMQTWFQGDGYLDTSFRAYEAGLRAWNRRTPPPPSSEANVNDAKLKERQP